jgi:HEAT repeats
VHSSLHTEVGNFRTWASNYPIDKRSGEWECDYEGWPVLNHCFEAYLESRSPQDADTQAVSDLIYAVARDNEMEGLVSELGKRPRWFAFLLPHVLECDEPDTRWQFAVMLGQSVLPFDETEGALLRLVEDRQEYVSRMALQALGRIRSKQTEGLCERAWATNHEYQRIMALWVLKEIDSPKLSTYLTFAKEDGRKYVVSNAVEIENS